MAAYEAISYHLCAECQGALVADRECGFVCVKCGLVASRVYMDEFGDNERMGGVYHDGEADTAACAMQSMYDSLIFSSSTYSAATVAGVTKDPLVDKQFKRLQRMSLVQSASQGGRGKAARAGCKFIELCVGVVSNCLNWSDTQKSLIRADAISRWQAYASPIIANNGKINRLELSCAAFIIESAQARGFGISLILMSNCAITAMAQHGRRTDLASPSEFRLHLRSRMKSLGISAVVCVQTHLREVGEIVKVNKVYCGLDKVEVDRKVAHTLAIYREILMDPDREPETKSLRWLHQHAAAVAAVLVRSSLNHVQHTAVNPGRVNSSMRVIRNAAMRKLAPNMKLKTVPLSSVRVTWADMGPKFAAVPITTRDTAISYLKMLDKRLVVGLERKRGLPKADNTRPAKRARIEVK